MLHRLVRYVEVATLVMPLPAFAQFDPMLAKFGASDTRKRLLERWEKDVNSAAT